MVGVHGQILTLKENLAKKTPERSEPTGYKSLVHSKVFHQNLKISTINENKKY